MRILVSAIACFAVCGSVLAGIIDTGVINEDYSDKALARRAEIYRRGYTEVPITIKIDSRTNRIVVR